MSLLEQYQAHLDFIQQQGLQRSCITSNMLAGASIERDGQAVVDFCSNDYLGFSKHPKLLQAAQQALSSYGLGTGGSRLIGGTHPLHVQLEKAVCHFKKTEAALLFNTGYQGNLTVITALADRHSVIYSDKLNHASIVDGCLLSRAKIIRYPHLDLDFLERALQQTPSKTLKLIITDSVFSMDGDIAPLKALFALAERYDALLLIDEAHGTGVFGQEKHSGVWETTGLTSDRVLQFGTFSKALGGFGAYLAGHSTLIETCIQRGRGFIYSTSLPASICAANLAALQLLQVDKEPVERLWQNIRHFNHHAENLGVTASSPIIPLPAKENAMILAQALFESGFFVQAIRPPTVPEARLRITLSAKHTFSQIEGLIAVLSLMTESVL
jgi:8-amino-7-oxononanoate synthase